MSPEPFMRTSGGTLLKPIRMEGGEHVLCDCITKRNGTIRTQILVKDIIDFDRRRVPSKDTEESDKPKKPDMGRTMPVISRRTKIRKSRTPALVENTTSKTLDKPRGLSM